MENLNVMVRWTSGREQALAPLDAKGSLQDMMLQVEATTGVLACFQRLLLEQDEVSLRNDSTPLHALGLLNGASVSMMRMSFPAGVFESNFTQSRGVNGFFGFGAGDVFEESEYLRATFEVDGKITIYFKAEYDTGFQIVELQGSLRGMDDTGTTFHCDMSQTYGNFWRRENVQRCDIVASFKENAVVQLSPLSAQALTPFRDRSWTLQRVPCH